jgi:hypothetical protein
MPDVDELVSTHPGSRRSAIIDQAGEALWLYLTEPGEMAPANDCWLSNLRPGQASCTAQQRADLREAGLPPPAPASALNDPHQLSPSVPGAYRLQWSDDGEAVQALLGERVIAFIVAGIRGGFHAGLRVDCPWGHAFDAELHARAFGA